MTNPFLFRVLLLDIEGTTTPISFVKDVLFPYARNAMGAFLKVHWDESAVQSELQGLWCQHQRDLTAGTQGVIEFPNPSEKDAYREGMVQYLSLLIDCDRKITGLKALQGMIWREGYEKGTLRGEVFEDIPHVFKTLHERHLPIYIYSSGSIQAQKLLFAHIKDPESDGSGVLDLLQYLSGHFDTTSGSKQAPESYQKIANEIGVKPADVLFATDILDEANAAHKAGMQVVLMDRPGNTPQPSHRYPMLKDLNVLLL